ncbi:hypothetical protein RJ640_001771, partial [Escallonia rubra]
NTVIGGASVSTYASSSNDNSELWHKQLGHLSEGGMLELHKRKLLQGVKSCKFDFCKFCVFGKQKQLEPHLIGLNAFFPSKFRFSSSDRLKNSFEASHTLSIRVTALLLVWEVKLWMCNDLKIIPPEQDFPHSSIMEASAAPDRV